MDEKKTALLASKPSYGAADGGGGGDPTSTDIPVDVEDEEAIQALISQTGPDGLDSDEAHRRLVVFGYNELAEDEVNPCIKFLSYFWGPMPIMIWIAMILEMAQALQPGHEDHWTDFGVLLALQTLNGTVAFFEERNAGNAIAALKASLAPKANVKRDGVWTMQPARELVPGDLVNLKLGCIVPADCILGEGKPLEVDQAALTGESLPVTLFPGQHAKMGSTIQRGELECIVVATAANTFFGKAAALVAQVHNVGRFQKVLFRVMLSLMAIAIVLVAIILAVLLGDHSSSDLNMTCHGGPHNGHPCNTVNAGEATVCGVGEGHRCKLGGGDKLTAAVVLNAIGVAVVLLVASIPIAMQVVATVTMAVGARLLAQKKAIVARLSAIEELAGMQILCSDKTGTLTQNKLTLYEPIVIDPQSSPEDLVFTAALAAKRMKEGQDAIDFSIVNAARDQAGGGNLEDWEETDFIPFDPVIKRTEATVVPRGGGKPIRVSKGAPQVILDLCRPDAGGGGIASRDEWASRESRATQAVDDLASRGYRALGVARTDAATGKWVFLGVLSLYDPPRVDTQRTIERALAMGIEVKMITGDHTAIAKETARRLGMGGVIYSAESIKEHGAKDGTSTAQHFEETSPEIAKMIREADGFAEVMPEHKFNIVGQLMHLGFTCGMTGDGVNDAPALKKAHIGIAVEGATDAARAAADIVLTEPGLSVIIDAMVLSRKIFQRVRNYCIFRIAGTIQLICFFFLAIFVHPNEYFTDYTDAGSNEDHLYLPVIAIVLITLLNDACVLTIARDNVVANRHPQDWNLVEVFIVSTVLGIIACVGSYLMLVIGLHASTKYPDGKFADAFFWPMGNVACEGTTRGPLPIPGHPGSKAVDVSHYLCDDGGKTEALCNSQGGTCRRSSQIDYEQLLSVVYLKLALTDFITVFAARTRGMFWTRKPANALLAAFVVATGASTFISCIARWPGMKPIDPGVAGMVWAYSLVWFLIQDTAKTFCYWVLGRFHAPTKKVTEADHPMSPVIVRKNRNQTFSTADFLEYQSRRGHLRHSMSVPAMCRYGRENSYGGRVGRQPSFGHMKDFLKKQDEQSSTLV